MEIVVSGVVRVEGSKLDFVRPDEDDDVAEDDDELALEAIGSGACDRG